ncbi:hypothetical protein EMCRGX_G022856 [Ephydatia muelleri]
MVTTDAVLAVCDCEEVTLLSDVKSVDDTTVGVADDGTAASSASQSESKTMTTGDAAESGGGGGKCPALPHLADAYDTKRRAEPKRIRIAEHEKDEAEPETTERGKVSSSRVNQKRNKPLNLKSIMQSQKRNGLLKGNGIERVLNLVA